MISILLSVIFSIILGSLWYSPATPMGTYWMNVMGFSRPKTMTSEVKKSMYRAYLGSMLSSTILFTVYTTLSRMIGSVTLEEYLLLAGMLWIGCFVPAFGGSVLWEGKPFKLYAVHVGYYLALLLGCAIITAAL